MVISTGGSAWQRRVVDCSHPFLGLRGKNEKTVFDHRIDYDASEKRVCVYVRVDVSGAFIFYRPPRSVDAPRKSRHCGDDFFYFFLSLFHEQTNNINVSLIIQRSPDVHPQRLSSVLARIVYRCVFRSRDENGFRISIHTYRVIYSTCTIFVFFFEKHRRFSKFSFSPYANLGLVVAPVSVVLP